jgi:hypothetical protein
MVRVLTAVLKNSCQNRGHALTGPRDLPIFNFDVTARIARAVPDASDESGRQGCHPRQCCEAL